MSPSEIEFLDGIVKLETGELSTDLFEKPTDSKTYLHFHSDYPIHTESGFFWLGPKNEALMQQRR